MTSTGALTAYSGQKTGRSPSDKRVVKEPSSEKDVWWGPVNKEMTPEVRHLLPCDTSEECKRTLESPGLRRAILPYPAVYPSGLDVWKNKEQKTIPANARNEKRVCARMAVTQFQPLPREEHLIRG